MVPLTLRAEPQKDGKAVAFAAVEPGHAVQSISIAYPIRSGGMFGGRSLRLGATQPALDRRWVSQPL